MSSAKRGSCSECRRSKLRCNRVFPCESCIRRGCADICPDGALPATKGNKVLEAHAKNLEEQVKHMSARIQELEAELNATRVSDGRHRPLNQYDSTVDRHDMHDDAGWGRQGPQVEINRLQHRASSEGEQRANIDSTGSLSIDEHGQSKYHGETAGSEYLQDLFVDDDDDDISDLQLPSEILRLSDAYPFGVRGPAWDRDILAPYVPTRERALCIVQNYYAHGSWMFNLLSEKDFMTTVIDPLYGPVSDSAGSAKPDIRAVHPHLLSIFFLFLAMGVALDPNNVPGQQPLLARQYYTLSRAALSLVSICRHVNCATVQALFLAVKYIYTVNARRFEERWLLTGLCCRVALIMGLQRDSAEWNLDADEVQRRRLVFWDMYANEEWTSIVQGRPPSLLLQYADCRFPEYGGIREADWHAWKHRFSAICLTACTDHVHRLRTPGYQALLELDAKIRGLPIPEALRAPKPGGDDRRTWSSDSNRAMQQYCAQNCVEISLMFVHRSYFVQALRRSPREPLHDPYGASVYSVIKTACSVGASLRDLYQVHSHAVRTIWFFWANLFSACIILGALVVETPDCSLAPEALAELTKSVELYGEGSAQSRPPATWIMLPKLLQRAQATFQARQRWRSSSLQSRDDSAPSQSPAPSRAGWPDELDVLGGRKSVVNARRSSESPRGTSPRLKRKRSPTAPDDDRPYYRDGDPSTFRDGKIPFRDGSAPYDGVYHRDHSGAAAAYRDGEYDRRCEAAYLRPTSFVREDGSFIRQDTMGLDRGLDERAVLAADGRVTREYEEPAVYRDRPAAAGYDDRMADEQEYAIPPVLPGGGVRTTSALPPIHVPPHMPHSSLSSTYLMSVAPPLSSPSSHASPPSPETQPPPPPLSPTYAGLSMSDTRVYDPMYGLLASGAAGGGARLRDSGRSTGGHPQTPDQAHHGRFRTADSVLGFSDVQRTGPNQQDIWQTFMYDFGGPRGHLE